jgi:hypothetical protein
MIDSETPLFDYGCGRGDDFRILPAMGYSGYGWDPVHRPVGQLPLALQRDFKAFFQSYAQACKQADDLLFSVGKTEQVNATRCGSPIGKKTEALYVHVSVIDQLPASLRVFEGCVSDASKVPIFSSEPARSEDFLPQLPNLRRGPSPRAWADPLSPSPAFRVRTRDYSEFRSPPIGTRCSQRKAGPCAVIV